MKMILLRFAFFVFLLVPIFSVSSHLFTIEKVLIKNLNVSYLDGQGGGLADLFDVVTINSMSTPNMRVELSIFQQADGFLFNYGDDEFFWERPPAFLFDIKKMDMSGLNLDMSEKKVGFNFSRFQGVREAERMNIERLKTNCVLYPIDNLKDQLLESCLKNGSIRVKVGEFTKNVKTMLSKVLFDQEIISDDVKVEDLGVDIKNHRFKMWADISASMSASVKIEGQTHYLKESNQVRIRIDKAKASFFNIKDRLFKELKRKESENFKVSKPYLYLNF